MKNTNLQKLSVLSLSLLALTASAISAQAETTKTNQVSSETAEISFSDEQIAIVDFDEARDFVVEPMPGTVATSADVLMRPTQGTNLPANQAELEATDTPEVAQGTLGIGRPTRSGPSYIGAGVNVGVGGDTGLGGTNFAINSKIGLTNTLSVRPAVIFGDDTAFLVPVTYDFRFARDVPFETDLPFAPFAGGGVIFTTSDNDNVGFLLTGGVDVPLSNRLTANATVNAAFKDETEVGLLFGVGYTFPGF